MQTQNRNGTLLISALLAALAACGGAASDTSQSQGGLTIHPGGPATGALVVNPPPGLAPPDAYSLGVRKASEPDGQVLSFKMGVPVQLNPDTTYCLLLDGLSDCTVDVQATQTTTYTLAALQALYTDGELATEFGSLAVRFSKSNNEMIGYRPNPWVWTHSGVAVPAYLVPAGDYQANFSPAWTPVRSNIPMPEQQSLTLLQGQRVAWQVAVTEWRFRIHLIAPEREFPDVLGVKMLPNNGVANVSTTYSITDTLGGSEDFPTPAGDRTLWLPAATPAGFNYSLSVFGTAMTIPAGATGEITDVQISRLEVDDVTYTAPDGGPATSAGAWSATRSGGAPGPSTDTRLQWQLAYNPYTGQEPYWEWIPQLKFPTKTGLDVIAGHYTGEVDYNLQDLGGPAVDTFTADF